MNLETNYLAETAIRAEIKRRNSTLAGRLEWDTESGAVGIFAVNERDIRFVAEVIDALLDANSRPVSGSKSDE